MNGGKEEPRRKEMSAARTAVHRAPGSAGCQLRGEEFNGARGARDPGAGRTEAAESGRGGKRGGGW